MAFSPVLHLWTAEFSPHPAHNPLSPGGNRWGGVNKSIPNTSTLYHTPGAWERRTSLGVNCFQHRLHGHSLLSSQLSCTCSFDLHLFFGPALLLGIVVSCVFVSFCLPFQLFSCLSFPRLGDLSSTLYPHSLDTLPLSMLLSEKDLGDSEVAHSEAIDKCWVPALQKN